MTSLSDTLTVGLVLVLLFGSIALYLYTRLQQAEQKISLLESILLDLKMSAEIKSYSELPASDHQEDNRPHGYAAFNDNDGDNEGANEDVSANQDMGESGCPVLGAAISAINSSSESALQTAHSETKNTEYVPLDDAVQLEPESKDTKDTTVRMSANYESMTLKELQTLAKNRGISGAGTMKKGSIIEALKTSDRSSTVEPGSTLLGGSGSSSFLETSGSFSAAESS
jgi:hypothetical protein